MPDNDYAPTVCLSKAFKDFVVLWHMKDIKEHIDPNLFGSLKGVSTTFCLLDMLHNSLSALESPVTYSDSVLFRFLESV